MIRSLIYSITFHSVLVLLTILSLPFMLREPVDLPPIVSVELIQITDKTLHMIQQMYNSDIRSMINFIQSRYESEFQEISIIHEEVWENMYNIFQNTSDTKDTLLHIENIKLLYNIDKLNIINDFLNYILRHHTEMISSDFLLFVENVVHSQKNSKYLINYAISQLHLSIPKL